jgi:hypothetical protein
MQAITWLAAYSGIASFFRKRCSRFSRCTWRVPLIGYCRTTADK